MPNFEYCCGDCGNRFEAILFGDQKPMCPKCHAQNLQQQLSTFAVSTKATTSSGGGCGADNCCMGNGGCSVD
jgi:putative FmdB family regulatory protein